MIKGYDEMIQYIAQCDIVPVRLAASAEEEIVATLQRLVPTMQLRLVRKLFRTVCVHPVDQGEGKPSEKSKGCQDAAGPSSAGDSGGWVGIKMVLNEWMRGAWPFH